MQFERDLIFDIGMSEGNDTDFYLKKGFRVAGVEADPGLQARLQSRFSTEISSGVLRIEHKAAGRHSGESVVFFSDPEYQGHSGLSFPPRAKRESVKEHVVSTISWGELIDRHGVPYYMKLDVEGAEVAFLEGMAECNGMTPFISAELKNFEPIVMFKKLGYSRFRLINQVMHSNFHTPYPPLEGNYVENSFRHHWSGYFGKELPGKKWFTFDEIKRIYDGIRELWAHGTLVPGWFDCHAWFEGIEE